MRKLSGEVEALRGLAALGVLVSHCWAVGHAAAYVYGTKQGRLGLVPGEGLALFFVLSGYLLTRLLIRGAAPDHRQYFRHRVARIIPTWWFVLAFLVLLDEDVVRRSVLWRFPLLLQGFWTDTVLKLDAPAWSLAVEAQFYLLLPLIAWVLRRNATAAALMVGALVVGTTTVYLTTVLNAHPSETWRYSLPANLVAFVPGIALATAEVRTDLVRRLSVVPHVRGWLLLASLPFWFAYAAFPRAGQLDCVGAGFTVAAVALPLGDSRVLDVLRARWLTVLGALSFGLYLWHTPILQVLLDHDVTSWPALLVLDLVLSAAAAAVTHVLVERPGIALRDKGLRVFSPMTGPARLLGVGAATAAVVGLVGVLT